MRKNTIIFMLLFLCITVYASPEIDNNSTSESFKISEAVIGGIIGSILGVISGWVSSYIGPRSFEKWKAKQIEEKQDGPRKKLLLEMLEDKNFKDGRKLSTLCMVTGTDKEECRRLLIQLNARGIYFKNLPISDNEGWVLIKNKPLTEK